MLVVKSLEWASLVHIALERAQLTAQGSTVVDKLYQVLALTGWLSS
jgi:hypothetical protein